MAVTAWGAVCNVELLQPVSLCLILTFLAGRYTAILVSLGWITCRIDRQRDHPPDCQRLQGLHSLLNKRSEPEPSRMFSRHPHLKYRGIRTNPKPSTYCCNSRRCPKIAEQLSFHPSRCCGKLKNPSKARRNHLLALPICRVI